MAVILTPPYLQFVDNNGNPLANGKVFTYSAGTTTPKATFTTPAADVQLPNPIILDSSGRVLAFGEGSYRFDVFDQDDNLIRTSDNVTTFTSLDQAGEPFFQSFSGDGSTTVFTLSESLGNNSKDILVFVDDSQANLATNGTFATDTDWTKGSGWAIAAGVATATTANTALSQTSSTPLVEDNQYSLTYTITRTAGSITPSIGGTNGTTRSAAGTYTEIITCGSTQDFAFTGSGFSGTVDNVVIASAEGANYQVQNPSFYTLSLTNLTFNTAPATGTNNIYVFAPSKLLGGAALAADTAETAAATATAAKNDAESAAGLVDITSTTSVAIGTGGKVFTVGSGLSLNAGQFVLITSDADPSNFMWGTIASYSSTTLTVTVEAIGGVGTYADWTIRLTGARGAEGATGTVTAADSVTAATSAGASLNSFSDAVCASWGAGSGQNFTVTNTLSFGAGGATIDIIRDEDDMVSDDANAVPTQQSVKAYVDDRVSQTVKTDTFTTTSTGFVAVTGLTIDVTPKSASSTFLVRAVINVSHGTSSIALGARLTRGGSPIGVGAAAGSRTSVGGGQIHSGNNAGLQPIVIEFIDSPATASTVTYAVEIYNPSGSFHVNRSASDTNGSDFLRSISTITVTELT